MARGQFTAQTRVQVLLDDIKDGYLELEDIAEVRRAKLEQCRNLRQFEIDAEQVIMHLSHLRKNLRSKPLCLPVECLGSWVQIPIRTV